MYRLSVVSALTEKDLQYLWSNICMFIRIKAGLVLEVCLCVYELLWKALQSAACSAHYQCFMLCGVLQGY